jgi:hypothetical protein
LASSKKVALDFTRSDIASPNNIKLLVAKDKFDPKPNSGECQQFEALLKFRVSSQWAGSSIRRGKGRKP